MLIANVQMDENEGLYINLRNIRNRIHNIEEQLEPEEAATYSAELVNEIDVGEKATFKAWTACYYTYATKVVGTYTDIVLRPEFNFIGTAYGVNSSNAFSTGASWTDSLNYDEDSDTYFASGTVHTNGILFNFTSTNCDIQTVLSAATKDVVIWSEGWLSDYTKTIQQYCTNTFYPWYKYEKPITTTVYTRVLNKDITYYTLNEADSGNTDMNYYLTAPDTSNTYSLIEADIKTAPFFCILNGTIPQKDFSSLQVQWANYLTPNKLSSIKEETICTPCLANYTILTFEGLSTTSVYSVYYSNALNYLGAWYVKDYYKNGCDGYLVSDSKYKEAFIGAGVSKYVLSSLNNMFITCNINDKLQAYNNDTITVVYENEGDFARSCEHFILAQNKYVSKDEFAAYLYSLPHFAEESPYVYESETDVEKERDSDSVQIAKIVNDITTTTILKSSLKYKGLSDSYTYQNYTFKDLSVVAPTPVYMKGVDGKMYLIAMKRTHSNGYDDDGNQITDHIYYGPCYITISHPKASFTPFGTYSRYDEDIFSSPLGEQGAFIRNSALDTTTTLEGVVVVTEDIGGSFTDYYNPSCNFSTFKKPATKDTVTTIIHSITTSELQ